MWPLPASKQCAIPMLWNSHSRPLAGLGLILEQRKACLFIAYWGLWHLDAEVGSLEMAKQIPAVIGIRPTSAGLMGQADIWYDIILVHRRSPGKRLISYFSFGNGKLWTSSMVALPVAWKTSTSISDISMTMGGSICGTAVLLSR